MNNIYLIGMPGSGKSSVGKQIAEKLAVRCIDLDEYICRAHNKTIDELFADGEGAFRDAETQALREVSNLSGVIVSTGGGIVCRNENAEIMKKSGTVVFIDTDVKNILANSALSGRPLLKDKNAIYTLYDERIEKYRAAAQYTVDNNGFLCDACDEAEKIVRAKLDI